MIRTFASLALAGALATGLTLAPPARAETVLRIAMTAADIPRTSGQPDQGGEGYRFSGYTMYDALVLWDLSSAERTSGLVPGLATEWRLDPNDRTKWTFRLRPGVRFHDGSPFDADAAIWNFRKVLDREAPWFDAAQAGVTVSRMPMVTGARKIDAMTIEVTTNEPDSILPFGITNLLFASPAHWQRLFEAVPASVTDPAERARQAWNAFAANASGTGPWRMTRFVPRERVELAANRDYWDAARRPKVDRMVLLPIPDANARVAALLGGQVDWIEAPAPDALPQLRTRGFRISENPIPHVWPWQFSFADGSPFADRRVRQAANLCIDRAAIRQLLGGQMREAQGVVPPDHPWFGQPSFRIRHAPDEARRLMTEAGFSAQRPATVKIQISASGSGQMQPLPMNEVMQQNLAECFFRVEFDVVDWATLFSNWRRGAGDAALRGAHAINVSSATMDPFFAMTRFVECRMRPPVSVNWGLVCTPEFDELVRAGKQAFDSQSANAAFARLHQRMVDEAVFLWVGHDVGPRAMSPRVQGFVHARSWFLDFGSITMQ